MIMQAGKILKNMSKTSLPKKHNEQMSEQDIFYFISILWF